MTGAVPLDRRQRRRQQTIDEVLDVAAEVMAEQGVAGLTLGEVARRMGIRPPSLYGYFDGKHALYDALFERGWRQLLDTMRTAYERIRHDEPAARFHQGMAVFTRWTAEHPAYTPLMMWRPVPGFTPSARAFEPAVEMFALGRAFLDDLCDAGLLRREVDLDRAFRTLTALTSGVVTQQLANAPDEPFDTGTYTATLPDLLDMWLAHYRTDTTQEDR